MLQPEAHPWQLYPFVPWGRCPPRSRVGRNFSYRLNRRLSSHRSPESTPLDTRQGIALAMPRRSPARKPMIVPFIQFRARKSEFSPFGSVGSYIVSILHTTSHESHVPTPTRNFYTPRHTSRYVHQRLQIERRRRSRVVRVASYGIRAMPPAPPLHTTYGTSHTVYLSALSHRVDA